MIHSLNEAVDTRPKFSQKLRELADEIDKADNMPHSMIICTGWNGVQTEHSFFVQLTKNSNILTIIGSLECLKNDLIMKHNGAGFLKK